MTKCQKQKLNVKSLTEGEIVGVSDYFSNMIWARMFIEAQGYPLKENILCQDNQSAIKIIKNGRRSSGKKQGIWTFGTCATRAGWRVKKLGLSTAPWRACSRISLLNLFRESCSENYERSLWVTNILIPFMRVQRMLRHRSVLEKMYPERTLIVPMASRLTTVRVTKVILAVVKVTRWIRLSRVRLCLGPTW